MRYLCGASVLGNQPHTRHAYDYNLDVAVADHREEQAAQVGGRERECVCVCVCVCVRERERERERGERERERESERARISSLRLFLMAAQ